MPTRRHTFKTGQSYHLFDKSLDHALIFENKHCSKAFIDALSYYRFDVPKVSLSTYKRLSQQDKKFLFHEHMNENDALVFIRCFELMPNHYHLLVQQKKDNGILRLMTKTLNSFTRYYNRLHQRKGPILLPQFKSVEILNTRQLIYTSKYIHLNPLRAGIVQSKEELYRYKYSSFQNYAYKNSQYKWIKTSGVLKHFNHSHEAYRNYIFGDENLD